MTNTGQQELFSLPEPPKRMLVLHRKIVFKLEKAHARKIYAELVSAGQNRGFEASAVSDPFRREESGTERLFFQKREDGYWYLLVSDLKEGWRVERNMGPLCKEFPESRVYGKHTMVPTTFVYTDLHGRGGHAWSKIQVNRIVYIVPG